MDYQLACIRLTYYKARRTNRYYLCNAGKIFYKQ